MSKTRRKSKKIQQRINKMTGAGHYMPNLNDMNDKEYHKKGTLYNILLEPFVIEEYQLWSVELAVRFCQEHNIRTILDCLIYSAQRNNPDMFE